MERGRGFKQLLWVMSFTPFDPNDVQDIWASDVLLGQNNPIRSFSSLHLMLLNSRKKTHLGNRFRGGKEQNGFQDILSFLGPEGMKTIGAKRDVLNVS